MKAVDPDPRVRAPLRYPVPRELGGQELAQRLSELRPGLPVIFMSGYADADLSSRGLLESGIPYLEKPFSPDALTRMMRAVLLRPA